MSGKSKKIAKTVKADEDDFKRFQELKAYVYDDHHDVPRSDRQMFKFIVAFVDANKELFEEFVGVY